MQNSALPFAIFPTSAQELIAEAKKLLPPKDAIAAEAAEAKVRQAIEIAEGDAAAATSVDLGSAYLFLGQILELQGKPEKLVAAGQAYDRAKDVFIALAEPTPPMQRMLALSWMNRGNIFQKLGSAEDVSAYDEAIRLLGSQEGEIESDSVRGAVYLNRGTALQRQNNPDARRAAAESFLTAISILEKLSGEKQMQFVPLLASARVNYAAVLMGVPGSDFKTIRSSAIAGLQIVAGAENTEYGAADLGLKARRVLCESMAQLIPNPKLPNKVRGELVSEGTDFAESALALGARWEQRNVTAFRPMIGWFFSFGSLLYARQQPQFLSEFLADTLAAETTPAPWKASPQLAKIAVDAIAMARASLQERRAQPGDEQIPASIDELLAELDQAASKYGDLAKSA